MIEHGPITTGADDVLCLVIRGGALDFFFGTQVHRNALVQAFRLNVENTLMAVSGRTASLFDREGHRVGFVHQAQLARLEGSRLSRGYMNRPPRVRIRCTSATIAATQRML